MTDFTGKTAIVTGAASGIGRATAKALADAGATVTLLDVQDELGARAAEDAGGTYAHLDVSDPDAWAELLGGFERLDLLHLNAGIYDTALADITSISDRALPRVPRASTSTACSSACASAIPLLEQANGAVVVTSSMAGVVPLPANPLYSLDQVRAHRPGAQHPRRARAARHPHQRAVPGRGGDAAHGRGPARLVRRARHRRLRTRRPGRHRRRAAWTPTAAARSCSTGRRGSPRRSSSRGCPSTDRASRHRASSGGVVGEPAGTLLEVRELDVWYGRVQVLFGLDLDVGARRSGRDARHQRRGQDDAAARRSVGWWRRRAGRSSSTATT